MKYKRTGAGHGVARLQQESSTRLACSTAGEKSEEMLEAAKNRKQHKNENLCPGSKMKQ
jgi:hypothetical protein